MEFSHLKNKIMADLFSRNRDNRVFLTPKICQSDFFPEQIIVECKEIEITQRNNGRPKTKFFTYDKNGDFVSHDGLSRDEINSLIDL
jgi:hypothetical protein